MPTDVACGLAIDLGDRDVPVLSGVVQTAGQGAVTVPPVAVLAGEDDLADPWPEGVLVERPERRDRQFDDSFEVAVMKVRMCMDDASRCSALVAEIAAARSAPATRCTRSSPSIPGRSHRPHSIALTPSRGP